MSRRSREEAAPEDAAIEIMIQSAMFFEHAHSKA